MVKYETISVKVPAEFKQKMKKYGINSSKLLRKTLEQEIRTREIEEIQSEIQELGDILDKIDMADVVANIKSDRESR